MAEKTPKFGLTKPLPEEFYDVAVQNDNMDIIDDALFASGMGKTVRELTTVAELEALSENCFFSYNGEKLFNSSEVHSSGVTRGGGWHIQCGNRYTQVFIMDYPNFGSMLKRTGFSYYSGYSDWEWINPPMKNFVEYLTTEKYYAASIYKKNENGIVKFKEDADGEWKDYCILTGAAPAIEEYYKYVKLLSKL